MSQQSSPVNRIEAIGSTAGAFPAWDANRFGLDYAKEATLFGTPPVAITDGHAHINGAEAAAVFGDVMDAYGVAGVISQTQIADAPAVRDALGDRILFLATPQYDSDDRAFALSQGYYELLDQWHEEFGARAVKFWNAPRLRDYIETQDDMNKLVLDGEWRTKIAHKAVDLGMVLMTHIADPDTWFATKYADASVYGTKREQYEPLERMLDRFDTPWLAAHMGGWPEDLEFLTGMLKRHPNLYLDTSATKWMVRELSKHSRDELIGFLRAHRGRVLFGSDIVSTDEHLSLADGEGHDIRKQHAQQASGRDQAFQLYASRYWALRAMWESEYVGESPIVDPDLMMVDPETYMETSAPPLTGHHMPDDVYADLYHNAAQNLFGPMPWDK